jgi:hypothetical protein
MNGSLVDKEYRRESGLLTTRNSQIHSNRVSATHRSFQRQRMVRTIKEFHRGESKMRLSDVLEIVHPSGTLKLVVRRTDTLGDKGTRPIP